MAELSVGVLGTHSFSSASLSKRHGPYEEAEPLCQRALAILEQQLGPEHPQVAYPLSNLADLYREQSRYEEAEPLYQRALQIREQALGPEHPETAKTLHNLAEFRKQQEKFQEALLYFQRALAIRQQVFGAHHPKTQETRTVYHALLEQMGKDRPCEENDVLVETSRKESMGKSAQVPGESCVDPSAKPRCPHCQSDAAVIKSGTNRSGTQRFFCRVCTRSFTPHARPQGVDASLKEQAVILNAQGKSHRAIARMLGVDHQSVRRWLQAAQSRPKAGNIEKREQG